MYTTTFLVALGLAAQGALAGGRGGSWQDAKPFSCPGNTPTTCSPDQSSGFGSNGWSGVSSGQSVSSFGGCGWSGVTCQDKGPGGKLAKRGGSDKCLSGKISGSSDECPKMSAGHGSGSGSTFSPDTYHISCSYDTKVDFNYVMQDGSSCKHTSDCSASGTDVQNTQCGGAVSVSCSQNEDEKKKNSGKDCSMGFHSVGFHCGTATTFSISTPPATHPATEEHHSTSTPTESKPVTSTPVESHPATSTPVESHPATSTPVESKPLTSGPYESRPATSTPVESKPATSTPVESKPATSTPVESKPATSTPVESKPATSTPVESTPLTTSPVESTPQTTTPVATTRPSSAPYESRNHTHSFSTTTFMTASTVRVTTEITVTSCAATITNCPAESRTPMVVTSTISEYTTICPVTATMIKSGSSFVPVVSETKPVVPQISSSASTSPAAQSTPSSVPVTCPDVVPSCINTLLQTIETQCKGNTDSACFCSAANHTNFIQDCITAHGADQSEVNEALSYFQGLCAPQVPQNPSIITNQPGGSPQQAVIPSGVPATTITVSYTTTVPCSESNSPPTVTPQISTAQGTTIKVTSTSMTVLTTHTVVTVPNVQITTATPTPGATVSSASVGLVGGGPTCTEENKQPGTTSPAAAGGPPTPAVVSATRSATPVYGGGPMYTGAVGSTGVHPASNTAVNPPIATGAAGKVGVSFGAVVVAAALLL